MIEFLRWLLLLLRNGRKPTPEPPPEPPSDPTVPEKPLLALHNAIRSGRGLKLLAWNERLAVAAMGHAQWMHDSGKISHTQPGGVGPGDRIRREGYGARAWGENIAAGYDSEQVVMDGWMHSSGHRANILGSQFQEMGAAVVGRSWCVVFASPVASDQEFSRCLQAFYEPPALILAGGAW